MNETEKAQLLEKFPEIITLVSKIKSLAALDIDFYRDNIFMTILTNTHSYCYSFLMNNKYNKGRVGGCFICIGRV